MIVIAVLSRLWTARLASANGMQGVTEVPTMASGEPQIIPL